MSRKDLKNERIGEISKNKYGTKMKIIEYTNNKNIIVEFMDEYKCQKKTSYRAFKNGEVSNLYDRTIYNVGYIGKGEYNQYLPNNKVTREYDEWKGMLRRCYDEKFHIKQPTYKDCTVCEEWLNFQNFAKWYEENYYEVDGKPTFLDKDILIKGNKVYSPQTCVFAPRRINVLFNKNQAIRGNYPIGVSLFKENYCSRCNIVNKNNKSERVFLGYYNTPEEAFQSYKEFKEKYIKEIADEYKPYIPRELYKAMYEYEVEIDD